MYTKCVFVSQLHNHFQFFGPAPAALGCASAADCWTDPLEGSAGGQFQTEPSSSASRFGINRTTLKGLEALDGRPYWASAVLTRRMSNLLRPEVRRLLLVIFCGFIRVTLQPNFDAAHTSPRSPFSRPFSLTSAPRLFRLQFVRDFARAETCGNAGRF